MGLCSEVILLPDFRILICGSEGMVLLPSFGVQHRVDGFCMFLLFLFFRAHDIPSDPFMGSSCMGIEVEKQGSNAVLRQFLDLSLPFTGLQQKYLKKHISIQAIQVLRAITWSQCFFMPDGCVHSVFGI